VKEKGLQDENRGRESVTSVKEPAAAILKGRCKRYLPLVQKNVGDAKKGHESMTPYSWGKIIALELWGRMERFLTRSQLAGEQRGQKKGGRPLPNDCSEGPIYLQAKRETRGFDSAACFGEV